MPHCCHTSHEESGIHIFSVPNLCLNHCYLCITVTPPKWTLTFEDKQTALTKSYVHIHKWQAWHHGRSPWLHAHSQVPGTNVTIGYTATRRTVQIRSSLRWDHWITSSLYVHSPDIDHQSFLDKSNHMLKQRFHCAQQKLYMKFKEHREMNDTVLLNVYYRSRTEPRLHYLNSPTSSTVSQFVKKKKKSLNRTYLAHERKAHAKRLVSPPQSCWWSAVDTSTSLWDPV